MDKTLLNGTKLRLYNYSNSQSGSIQYTNSTLLIKGPGVTMESELFSYGPFQSYNTSQTECFFSAREDGEHNIINVGSGASYPTIISVGGNLVGDTVAVYSECYFNNTITSDIFISGFAGSGWEILKNPSNRYVAQFDDLWLRGSLNVYEMVIKQIRSTNGSLWVTDASKATSASYISASNALILSFQTGSLVPFIEGDILRSKRWGLSGSTIQSQWDITTTVSAINYITGYVTLSAPTTNGNYTITSSANGTWYQIAQKLSTSGSQWVRVGHRTNDDRKGAIYLTSTDLSGPFIDVYDGIKMATQATGGASNSVTTSNVKVRLGKLSGITDTTFGTLTGYGLYSTNVYLKGNISASNGSFNGTISANSGNIGGWDITSTSLYKSGNWKTVSISTKSIQYYDADGCSRLSIGQNQNLADYGIWCGYDDGDSAQFPYFTVDNSGAYLSGGIDAGYGSIGSWNISPTRLYAGNITISAIPNNPAILIGSTDYISSNGIYLGSSSTHGTRMSVMNGANKLLFDGTNIGITTSNFTLSQGVIYANNAVISGSISSSIGNIGGWTINSTNISSSGIILQSSPRPQLKIGSENYGSNGIWIGKDTATAYRMSLINGTTKVLWDGTNVGITTSNFILSQGNISASNAIIGGTIRAQSGYIGNWNINSTGIYKTSALSTVSITTNGYDNLVLSDVYGNFTFSAANSGLFTNISDNYKGNFIFGDWTAGSYTTIAPTFLGTKITIRSDVPANTKQSLVKYNSSTELTIYKNITYVLTTDCTPIHPLKQADMSKRGIAFLEIYTASSLTQSSLLYSFETDYLSIINGRDIQQRTFNIIYTGSDSSIKIYPALSFRLDEAITNQLYLTFSGLRIDKFNKVTQLSDKGLLVFNSPDNYLQINTTTNNVDTANAKLDKIYASDIITQNITASNAIINNSIAYYYTLYTASVASTFTITKQMITSSLKLPPVKIGMPVSVQYWVIDNSGTYQQYGPDMANSAYASQYTGSEVGIFDRIQCQTGITNTTWSVAVSFRIFG